MSHPIRPIAKPAKDSAVGPHWTSRRSCFDALNSALRPIRVVAQPARVVATAMVGPLFLVPITAAREMDSSVMLSSRNAGKNASAAEIGI